MRIAVVLASLLALVPLTATAAGYPDAYKVCRTCHQANGQGVPGSFPPLDGHIADFARTEAGRTYLVMVITNGVAGRLEVNGKRYQGVMPAQPRLKDPDIAEVLNFIIRDFAKAGPDVKDFSAEEVAAIKKAMGRKTPRDVAAMRPGAEKGKK